MCAPLTNQKAGIARRRAFLSLSEKSPGNGPQMGLCQMQHAQAEGKATHESRPRCVALPSTVCATCMLYLQPGHPWQTTSERGVCHLQTLPDSGRAPDGGNVHPVPDAPPPPPPRTQPALKQSGRRAKAGGLTAKFSRTSSMVPSYFCSRLDCCRRDSRTGAS